MRRVWSVRRDGRLIGVGTLHELELQTGMSQRTLLWMASREHDAVPDGMSCIEITGRLRQLEVMRERDLVVWELSKDHAERYVSAVLGISSRMVRSALGRVENGRYIC